MSNKTTRHIKAAVFAAAFLAFSHLSDAQDVHIAVPDITPPSGADTVSVVFIGDVMMHSRQLGYDSREFLGRIEPLLSGADIAVANAEFTMAGPPYTGYPRFSSPDDYACDICRNGVDVLMVANNHILDKGSAGFRRTLDKMPCPFTGAGRDAAEFAERNPLIVPCKGMRIAFVNFTYGTNLGGESLWPKVNRMDKDAISAQIARARERGADFIIALPHWGVEYSLVHNRSQEEWAVFLKEQGVDAVIGAHPHVVQDTCFIGSIPVVYSMGNAISNMSAPNTQLGLAVVLRMVCHNPSGARSLLRPELHFLWCSLPGEIGDNYLVVEAEDHVSDHPRMKQTLERVKEKTGIE